MIVVQCPYCLEQRTEIELIYGGEAGITRPVDPAAVSDQIWTEYLFFRSNTKGLLVELWCCASGCGQWFQVARHTVTHQIEKVCRLENANAQAPANPNEPAAAATGPR